MYQKWNMMMENIEEKAAKCEAELQELRKQSEKINRQFSAKNKHYKKLLLELNKDNLKEIAWLVKNPESPGVYEALNEMFEQFYGGTYNGPHPAGYYHDDNYKPIQKNFEFMIDSDGRKDRKEEFRKNIDHFLKTFLHHLDPVVEVECRFGNKLPPMKVIPFSFLSESSGIHYLGYEPQKGEWFYIELVYGTYDVLKKFKDFDEAFEFAYETVQNRNP